MLKCGHTLKGTIEMGFVYAIFPGSSCVYTGLLSYASTVCNAEGIAEAILKAEELKVDDLRFYDLQTRRYVDIWNEVPSGAYEYERVTYTTSDDRRLHATHWESVSCPPNVIELFQRFIGERPVQYQGNKPFLRLAA